MADYSTPEAYKRRREMAQALLLQGSSGDPVRHWSQGANRIAQALFGGLNMNAVNQEEKAAREDATKQLVAGLQSGSPSPQMLSALGNPMVPPALAQVGTSAVAHALNPKERVRPLTDPSERAKYGIPADDQNAYQVEGTGKVSAINPQRIAVNVNNTQETAFAKEGGKLQAGRFNDLAAEGPAAKQMLSDLDMLKTLGTQLQTGKIAEFKAAVGPYAEAVGVKVEGLPEIQAYEALVNRLAPNLRVKGSGAQSDYELRNFLKSLPNLGNTPEGNDIATRVLGGLYDNKVRAAEIGSAALSGKITREKAEQLLRELPDPMREYREFIKKNPVRSGSPTPPPVIKPGSYNWTPNGLVPAQ